MIEEITAKAMEQAAGIEQINKAVIQMDQITQQNAALVEESSATSETMTQQASELAESVAQFTLSGEVESALKQKRSSQAAQLREPASKTKLAVNASPARTSPVNLEIVDGGELEF
jgi:methyl-accepting chemotaxis protein